MGDVRFRAALERAEAAAREGRVDQVDPETAIQALGALSSPDRAVLANVLATRVLNQFRRSASLLRFVAEGVVALDGEGRVLFANPAAARMLGWDERDLLGRDFHDTVHHGKLGGGPVPREACAILRILDAAPEDGAHAADDHDVFRRRDGSTFLAGFIAAPIVHEGDSMGVALAFRDITSQKEREAALALHRAALDAVPTPVFWLARDGRILYANHAASEHLGYPREEIARMRVFDFDPEYKPAWWDEHWDAIKDGRLQRLESVHCTSSGERVPVQIDITHVEHGGQEFHVAVARRRA